jgi:hypothetical protein
MPFISNGYDVSSLQLPGNSGLTWTLFKEKHPEKKDPGGVNGNWHWVDKSGTPLWQLAENFYADQMKK